MASAEDDREKLDSLMDALRELRSTERPKPKKHTKRKRKGKKNNRRKSKAMGKYETTQTNGTQDDHEDDDEGEMEEETESFSWPPCACGIHHPPVESFTPPDGKTCTFYWQLADTFPFMALHRALTTEIKFLKADKDQSGVLEMPELTELLRGLLGKENVSDRLVERTFKEIDKDESGTLDFLEVLAMVDTMVQRKGNKLPETMQKEYSKVCSIQ